MVDQRVNYAEQVGDLLKEILQPGNSAGSSDVAQLLTAAGAEISPID